MYNLPLNEMRFFKVFNSEFASEPPKGILYEKNSEEYSQNARASLKLGREFNEIIK